jgi:type I restriction enzyme S subunit
MTGIIGGISLGNFLNLPVPLPPIAEQHRIIAKVDELMALCDTLEAQTEDSLKAHQTLVETCLATLTNSQSPEELTKNWARIETHFDTLFKTKENIDSLDQTIISLGVTGKLVAQDPKAEPARVLLARLAKEIEEYSKQNRIRQTRNAEVNLVDELPQSLPRGWTKTRLSSIFKVVTDGDHQAPPRAEQGIAFLTIGNVSSGTLEFDNCRMVPEEYFYNLAEYRTPAKGDILYTVVGATYGRPVLVKTEREFCVQRHIAILKPAHGLDRQYLVWLLKSNFMYQQAKAGITGSAQPTLALKPLRNFVVFLPPAEEQKRIAEAIRGMLNLTSRLREKVIAKNELAKSLSSALTSQIH